MEAVIAIPKTRKPRAKATVKEPTPEQPKTRKPRAKATIKEPTLEQPKAKAKSRAKTAIKEPTIEVPKATHKEPKRLILQSEKDELLQDQLKLKQFREAERVYNNAIKHLQR